MTSTNVMKEENKNNIYQDIVKEERENFPNLKSDVFDNIISSLSSNMSEREMTKLEVTTFAQELIKSQIGEAPDEKNDHENS